MMSEERMKKGKMHPVTKAVVFSASAAALNLAPHVAIAAPTGQELVNTTCQICHKSKEDGGLGRIINGRRTPEGWDMTVARMMYAHGIKLTQAERMAVVKYLSDAQGLAPEESQGYRYALERRPSVVEKFSNEKVGDTCARCHSYARIALQRRSEDDWRRLSNFHVGQFPTIELQNKGRDRNWFEIATKEIPVILGKEQGLNSKAWDDWKARKHADMSGTWRITGYRPGVGTYEGRATVSANGEDAYNVAMELHYDDGHSEKANGTSIVYSGHEWRASLKQDGADVRQVLSMAGDENHLKGRWFFEATEVTGGDLNAVREGGGSELLAVTPARIKLGTTQTVTLIGTNLKGEPQFGEGLVLKKIVSRSADKIVAEVEAKSNAVEGLQLVKVGGSNSSAEIAVFKKIDYIKVTPSNPMARIGGNGGPRPKVPAQLEAIAYSAGADGKPGTADDVLLGPVAASWKIQNLNKTAAKMEDAKFAGTISQSGLVSPADAGPNSKRKYGTNNAGELRAVATVKDGTREISAWSPLIVSVQLWVNPPIY